jgi:ribose-phosphate pyrophosphokinase
VNASSPRLDYLVFSTASYAQNAADLCRTLLTQTERVSSCALGQLHRRTFPDGEHYLRIEEPVTGRDVVLVGGTSTDSDTLEIYDLACSIVKYGARSLSLVIPYFGYATMERAVRAGEVVTAKTRARLFSSIPNGDAPNRIFLFDVHTEGLPYYFEGPSVPVHVYGKPLVMQLVQEIAKVTPDIVLACTDAGRAKWVESLANDMNLPASFVFKKRLEGDRTQVVAVSAQVQDKHVVIYDDMIRTGGSLMQAARAYLDSGATKVTAVTTHGIFPGDALAKIEASKLIAQIACTDSHPSARSLAGSYLRVESAAHLFAQAILART